MQSVFINGLILRDPFAGVGYTVFRLINALLAADQTRNYSVLIPRSLKRKFEKRPNLSLSRSLLVGGRSPFVRVFYEQALLPFSISRYTADFAHFPAYVAPRLLFVPFVVNIHDVIPYTHPAFCKPATVRHFNLAMPRTIERAHRIIVPTYFVKNTLLTVFKRTDPEKIAVVPFAPAHPPSGLSRSEARKVLSTKYSIRDPFFLFIGNIEPKKNLPTLLKAFFAAKMKRQFPHKLAIVGAKGWMGDHSLSALESHRMDDMVIMPGYVDEHDLPAFYRAATALCFPSFVEGFGLPVLEAMQEGTPCLLSDIPVFRELAGSLAKYQPLTDLEAWRYAIETAVDAGEDKKAEAARKERAAAYNWARTAKETLDVYNTMST